MEKSFSITLKILQDDAILASLMLHFFPIYILDAQNFKVFFSVKKTKRDTVSSLCFSNSLEIGFGWYDNWCASTIQVARSTIIKSETSFSRRSRYKGLVILRAKCWHIFGTDIPPSPPFVLRHKLTQKKSNIKCVSMRQKESKFWTKANLNLCWVE